MNNLTRTHQVMLKKSNYTQKIRSTLLLVALSASLPIIGHTAVTNNNLESQSYYEDALKRFEKDDFEGSIIQLKNVLKENSSHLPAAILMARSFLNSNRPDLAEQEIRRALLLGADPNLVVEFLLDSQIQQGKIDTVIEHSFIDKSKLNDAKLAKLYLYVGTALSLKTLWLDAERALEKAVQLNPADVTALTSQAQLKFNLGKLDEAKQQVDHLLVAFAPTAPLWSLKAGIAQQRGNLEQALQYYDEALKLDINDLEIIAEKAQQLLSLNRPEEALSLLEPHYETTSFNAAISYAYALSLTRTGQINSAKLVLADANSKLSEYGELTYQVNPSLKILAALIAYNSRDYHRALTYASQALAQFPHNTSLRTLLAESQIQLNGFNDALSTLRPMARNGTSDVGFLALYGHVLLQNGQYEKASEVLEKASSMAPESALIYANLGLAQLNAGKTEQAISTLEKANKNEQGFGRGGYMLAYFHMKNGQFEKAQKLLDQMLQQTPGSLLALNLSANLLIESGQYEEARNVLNSLLLSHPDFSLAILSFVKLDVQTGDMNAATARLKSALQASPQNTSYMAGLANLAELSDQQKTAIKWLEKIRSIDSKQTTYSERLINKYLETNQFEQALQVAKEVYIAHPDKFSVLVSMTKVQLASNQKSAARSTLREISRIQSLGTSEKFLLAQLQVEAADYSGAILSLTDTIRVSPDYVPAHIALARVEAARDNPSRALNIANNLDQQYPDSAFVYVLQAEIYATSGQLEKSLAYFKRAMTLEPSPSLAIKISGLLKLMKRDADALALLEEWNQREPKATLIKSKLAATYIQAEKWQQALGIYQTLTTDFPDEASFLNNLALIYLELEDERAITTAAKAYQLAPENPSILDTYGWSLNQNDRAQEGLKYLREAYARNSGKPAYRYHLASALHKLNKSNEALLLLDALIKQPVNFRERQDAEKLLQLLKTTQS